MFILYVDDDAEDQEVFCDALKIIDESIECVVVNDGLQALTLLSKTSQLPDYIFTDVNMPRMDGKMFLQNVKTNARFKDIPVIIISNRIHRDDEIVYMNLGAREILTKHSALNNLVNDLQSIIG